MIKINELYIRVNTSDKILEFSQRFSDKLNIITSYKNSRGKSTIGESILFCLGLEELLGHKNEKALKPALRSKIEIDGKEVEVVQSDIFLEIENNRGEYITILRSPLNNDRDSRLVSVFDEKLNDVIIGSLNYRDYFVHDPGSAQNIRGFHNYLEEFMGLDLPRVATYDGKETKLYLQTLTSGFYLEQKKGWVNILSTVPTYYRIKNLKKCVLEYILGLDVLETEKRYNIQKAKLNEVESDWNTLIHYMQMRSRKLTGIKLIGLKERPHVINSEEVISIMIDTEDNNPVELKTYISIIENELIKLGNLKDPTIENQSSALSRELIELEELLNKFTNQKQDVLENYHLESEQLEIIDQRLKIIEKDLSENKDLQKLKNLGSIEGSSIANSKCPTCGQDIDDTLFDQNNDFSTMTIEESIIHLKSEKQMLEFSRDAQQLSVNSLKVYMDKIDVRIGEISSRIRSVKSDLISNNKAISHSHIKKIVELEMRKKELVTFEIDIMNSWDQLKSQSKIWGENKAELDKIPLSFMTEKDVEILNYLKYNFSRLLKLFNYTSINTSHIAIDDYNYLPTVEGYDLHFDSSASDTIRIIWAYITSLCLVSNKYGRNFGFLVFDEPAQQNTDLSSAKELIREMIELSSNQQIFIMYKLESDELFDGLNPLSYFRIHSDDYLIKDQSN